MKFGCSWIFEYAFRKMCNSNTDVHPIVNFHLTFPLSPPGHLKCTKLLWTKTIIKLIQILSEWIRMASTWNWVDLVWTRRTYCTRWRPQNFQTPTIPVNWAGEQQMIDIECDENVKHFNWKICPKSGSICLRPDGFAKFKASKWWTISTFSILKCHNYIARNCQHTPPP